MEVMAVALGVGLALAILSFIVWIGDKRREAKEEAEQEREWEETGFDNHVKGLVDSIINLHGDNRPR